MQYAIIVKLILFTQLAFSYNNLKEYLGEYDFGGPVAPVVFGEPPETSTPAGSIIYDSSANVFKGLNTSGTWISMSPPSGTPITTSAANPMRIETVTVTPSYPTCTYTSASSSWVSSVSANATGDCTINMTGWHTGDSPNCTATVIYDIGTGATHAAHFRTKSNNALRVVVQTGTSGDNLPVEIICMGKN